MKKKLLSGIIILFFLSVVCYGQTNTPGKYAYAEVTLHIGAFNKHKTTAISFGTDYPAQVEKKEEITGKIISFKEGVDIKNYMNDMGWEYVDQQNLLFNDMIVVYTFRKPK